MKFIVIIEALVIIVLALRLWRQAKLLAQLQIDNARMHDLCAALQARLLLGGSGLLFIVLTTSLTTLTQQQPIYWRDQMKPNIESVLRDASQLNVSEQIALYRQLKERFDSSGTLVSQAEIAAQHARLEEHVARAVRHGKQRTARIKFNTLNAKPSISPSSSDEVLTVI